MENIAIWKRVMRECREILTANVDGWALAAKLRLCGVITFPEWELICRDVTPEESILKTLDNMITKDNYWKPLLDYLETAGQNHVKVIMMEAYERLEKQEVKKPYSKLDDEFIWNSVLSQCQDGLLRDLDIHQCATKLRLLNMLSRSEWEAILACPTTKEIFLKFLDTLVSKSHFWHPFLDYLEEANQMHLVEDLVEAYKRLERLQEERGATGIPLLTDEQANLQENIIRYIINECQPIEQIWRDLLPKIDVSDAYVGLDILSFSGKKKASLPVEDDDYSWIWMEPGSRIVIEGDPGVGKTTYLCNLAVNWARSFNKEDNDFYNKYGDLRKRFDFILYVPLGRVDADGMIEVVQAMDELSTMKTIESIFTSKALRTRLLLLLDGFEELDQQKLKEIDEIVNMNKFFEIKTVISTRPSHTVTIRKRHLSLKINGFSEEQAELFIRKQELNLTIMKQDLQLQSIRENGLYNPLQLSSFCVVGSSQRNLKLLDSADGYGLLIEWLIDHILGKKEHERTGAHPTEDEQFFQNLRELGPLAISHAVRDERQKKLLSNFAKPEAKNSKAFMAAEEAGIVFRKRFLSSKGGGLKHDFIFIHQVIAEFIAAHYLAEFTNNSEFCSSLCDAFYDIFESMDSMGNFFFFKEWQQSPLFYFLSKFSLDFATTAFEKMVLGLELPGTAKLEKLHIRSAPWFASLPKTLACNYSEIQMLNNAKPYSVVEILKVMRKRPYVNVSLAHSHLHKCLPTVLSLADELVLLECDVGDCVWSPNLVTTTNSLTIRSSNIPPGFSNLLCHLDSCIHLTIRLPTLTTLSYFTGIGSMKNLKELYLCNVDFTNSEVNEWCGASKSLNTLKHLDLQKCSFSLVDGPSILRLANLLEIENLVVCNCTFNKEFGSLFAEGTRLLSFLKVLIIVGIPSFEVLEPMLENLKNLSGLKAFMFGVGYLSRMLKEANFKEYRVDVSDEKTLEALQALKLATPGLTGLSEFEAFTESLPYWRSKISSGTLSKEDIQTFSKTADSIRLTPFQLGVIAGVIEEIIRSDVLMKLNEKQLAKLCRCVGEVRSSGDDLILVRLELAGDFTIRSVHLKPIFDNQSVKSLHICQPLLPISTLDIENVIPEGWTCELAKEFDGNKGALWKRCSPDIVQEFLKLPEETEKQLEQLKQFIEDFKEEEILISCEQYIDRASVLRRVFSYMYHIYSNAKAMQVTQYFRALKLCLQGMEKHLRDRDVQVSGTGALFSIMRNLRLSGDWNRRVIVALLAALREHMGESILIRNCCLSLCRFQSPQDVQFAYDEIVRLMIQALSSQPNDAVPQREIMYVLSSMTSLVDGERKMAASGVGAIEKVLDLICKRLTDGTCDEVMEVSWSFLWNVTDETPSNCEKFLHNNGMKLFHKCYQNFPEKTKLLRNMMGLMGNIAEVKSLRPELMSSEYIEIFCKLLETLTNDIALSYVSASVLAYLCSDGAEAWTIDKPTHEKVIETMNAVIRHWDLSVNEFINFRSFELIFRLVPLNDCSAAQHWALWTLAHLTFVAGTKYCPLVVKEGGVQLLENLSLEGNPLAAELKKLVTLTLSYVKKWRNLLSEESTVSETSDAAVDLRSEQS